MRITNKVIAISLLLATSLLLTACAKPSDHLDNPEADDNQPQAQNSNNGTTAMMQAEPEESKPNFFTSVRDAVTKNIVIKCRYKTDDDTFDMYLKGNKAALQAENDVGDKIVKFQGVIKDNKYYLWSDQSTDGMLIDLKKDREDPLEVNDKPVHSFDEVIDGLETSKESCVNATAPDSMFEVPGNITFKEW
jgi:major membrane immunogen (membrane-anchored lipoprotein)